MQPVGLWLVFACAWILLHWWLLPLVQAHWEAVDMRTKLLRSGVLVILEKLRDLAAVGAAVLAFVMLLILLFEWLARTDTILSKATIETIASMFQGTKELSTAYGAALGWLGLIGASVTLYFGVRHARSQVVAVWQKQARIEFESIIENPSLIDAALADPKLRPMAEHIKVLLAHLQALPDESEATSAHEQERARLRDALHDAIQYLAVEMANQKVDFAQAIGKPAEFPGPQPRPSAWRRLGKVLASTRLGSDMGLVRKPLGWVVTGLLLVSLTGWAADPMADSLRLAVNNLRVHLVGQDVQRQWDIALSRDTAPAEDADAAEVSPAMVGGTHAAAAGARMVARAIARELVDASVMTRLAGASGSTDVSTEFARATILGEDLSPSAQLPVDDKVQRLRAEVSAEAGKGESSAMRRVEEHLAPRVEAQLHELQHKNPGRFKAVMARVEARYGSSMTPLDAQSKLMARVLDEAMSGLDAKPAGELGRQAQALTKDFGKDAIKTWADSAVKRFLIDTMTGIARPDVLRGVKLEANARSREFVESLYRSEGQGWRSSTVAAAEARANEAVARTVAGLHDVPEPERLALRGRLSGYEGSFPRQSPGPVPEALLNDAPPGSGDSGGGDGKHADAPSGGAHPHRASGGRHDLPRSWATNMRTAARSFRVRGVLIGQDPQGPPLDVTDIRWEVTTAVAGKQASRVALAVRIAPGPGVLPRWQSIGSFDAGVINQAVRYAADRRVIATTITPGDGKVIRRLIYLHPALIDTPLGCRVVEADRFIDTFSFAMPGGTGPAAFSQLVHDREQMHSWLQLMGVAEIIAAAHTQVCPVKDVQTGLARRRVSRMTLSPTMNDALENFLHGRETGANGSTALIRGATSCARKPTETMAACLCSQANAMASDRSYWFPEDHTSQVREQAVSLSPDLNWLKSSSDRLGYLDLWVHTTFSLRDARTGESDESTVSALDFPKAGLDALRTKVRSQLPGYLRDRLGSASYDAFMAPLEEFVLAQRLVRAAFQGALGHGFPVSRLIELERQTRRYVPRQATIRWEPAVPIDLMYAALEKSDAHAAASFKAYQVDQVARKREGKPMCDVASL